MRADRLKPGEPAVYWIKVHPQGRNRHATRQIVEYPNPEFVNAVPLCAMKRTVFKQADPDDQSPVCKGCNEVIVSGDPEVYFPPPEEARPASARTAQDRRRP